MGQRGATPSLDAHVDVVGDVTQPPLNTETVAQVYTPWVQVSDGMIAACADLEQQAAGLARDTS